MCLSVCLSVYRGFTRRNYQWYIRTHCTGATSIPFPGPPLLVTSGSKDWRSIQKCSFKYNMYNLTISVDVLYWQLVAIKAHVYSWQVGDMHLTEMLSCSIGVFYSKLIPNGYIFRYIYNQCWWATAHGDTLCTRVQ